MQIDVQDAFYSASSRARDYYSVFTNNQDSDMINELGTWYQQNSVFFTERYSEETGFQYSIPLVNPGVYYLTLQFIETQFIEPGRRVFNVKLGSCHIAYNLDICQKSAAFHLHQEYLVIELTKKKEILNVLTHQVCKHAYSEATQKISIQFEKTEEGYPFVNSVILFQDKDKKHPTPHQTALQQLDAYKQAANIQLRNLQINTQDDIAQLHKFFKKISQIPKPKDESDYLPFAYDFTLYMKQPFDSIFDVIFSLKGLLIFGILQLIIFCATCIDDIDIKQDQADEISEQEQRKKDKKLSKKESRDRIKKAPKEDPKKLVPKPSQKAKYKHVDQSN